jgi:hypothetical protein
VEIKIVDYFHEATLWLTDSSPAYHLCITETGMSSSYYIIVDTLVVHLTKEFTLRCYLHAVSLGQQIKNNVREKSKTTTFCLRIRAVS